MATSFAYVSLLTAEELEFFVLRPGAGMVASVDQLLEVWHKANFQSNCSNFGK